MNLVSRRIEELCECELCMHIMYLQSVSSAQRIGGHVNCVKSFIQNNVLRCLGTLLLLSLSYTFEAFDFNYLSA